jgi:uncharacterized protein YhfF
MWAQFVAATGTAGQPADVYHFGDDARQADELGGLVLRGPKRATAGMVADYETDGIPLPQVGDHCVFVLGDGRPGGVLRTTDIRIGPLSSVDDQFAWDEGEGDRSLEYWMAAHVAYFTGRCAALGLAFSHDIEVAFERFDLVWPNPG